MAGRSEGRASMSLATGLAIAICVLLMVNSVTWSMARRRLHNGAVPDVLTLANTVAAGRPCEIYDAQGRHIPYVLCCNRKTGKVTRFHIDDNGQVVCGFGIDDLFRITDYWPAPLQVQWLETDDTRTSHGRTEFFPWLGKDNHGSDGFDGYL